MNTWLLGLGLGFRGGYARGNECLFRLVRMPFPGEGTVGFADVVLRGGGGNVEEIVEGGVARFVGQELIA